MDEYLNLFLKIFQWFCVLGSGVMGLKTGVECHRDGCFYPLKWTLTFMTLCLGALLFLIHGELKAGDSGLDQLLKK